LVTFTYAIDGRTLTLADEGVVTFWNTPERRRSVESNEVQTIV